MLPHRVSLPRSAIFLLFWTFHVKLSIQLNCYNVDGSVWDKQVQCPGSQSCCLTLGECTQNRLCAKPNNELIRGPCLNAQFDDCSPLCHYSMYSRKFPPSHERILTHTPANERNMFPRVHQCDDGSYCCDNSPDCCRNGTGIFLLPNGKLSSTTSSTVISSTAAATNTATSGALTSSSTPPGSSLTFMSLATPAGVSNLAATLLPSGVPERTNKSSTLNVKGIVIGVVVAVVAVATIIVVWILWQRRRTRKLEEGGTQGQSIYSEMYAPAGPESNWAKPAQQNEIAEMRGDGIHDRIVELPVSSTRSLPPATSPR